MAHPATTTCAIQSTNCFGTGPSLRLLVIPGGRGRDSSRRSKRFWDPLVASRTDTSRVKETESGTL